MADFKKHCSGYGFLGAFTAVSIFVETFLYSLVNLLIRESQFTVDMRSGVVPGGQQGRGMSTLFV